MQYAPKSDFHTRNPFARFTITRTRVVPLNREMIIARVNNVFISVFLYTHQLFLFTAKEITCTSLAVKRFIHIYMTLSIAAEWWWCLSGSHVGVNRTRIKRTRTTLPTTTILLYHGPIILCVLRTRARVTYCCAWHFIRGRNRSLSRPIAVLTKYEAQSMTVTYVQ
jgi:hypothetical protein